ncbi:nucleotide-binding domain-containing protein [Mycena pura]|uniref:Nucleotide-binding domain-containing protein n=1 Tax=Mycena pura TaxID=153505 RepID=A0AAD6YMN0_9AGAR|nr:nucleotide-binding domain-containing protein [Mycena pura]
MATGLFDHTGRKKVSNINFCAEVWRRIGRRSGAEPREKYSRYLLLRMGSILSRLRLIYQTLKSIYDSFAALSERISRDPGLPVPNPSRSYWSTHPSPLDELMKSTLPEYADIVIIGSGIAGTAVARTLLECHSKSDRKAEPLRVVMLEARDVCSGATGRNGGHISPNTYRDYQQLAASYGDSAAQAIIRFRLAHLSALLTVATEEDLLRGSQARIVEQYDVYLHDKVFRRAKDELAHYLSAVPDQDGKHTICEDGPAIQELQLTPSVAGCISQPGGALHPYNLVTGILRRLLTRYSSFKLFTHTPCTGIALAPGARSYLVTTPKGTVAAAHVVHATNAWAAHLLPGMRRKIVPMRAHMTAQRPGRALGADWAGRRAFVFYPGASPVAFDYLTQQTGAGELMFGGGALLDGRAEPALLDNLGVANDSGEDFGIAAYLGGALARYFSPAWGAEGGTPDADADAAEAWGAGRGRIAASWSGIVGFSADGQPWIGRVPRRVSLRAEPVAVALPGACAPPGEWIAAGFTGEGMTHAWLAGAALARMVLGDAADNENSDKAATLPPQFVITEKRLGKADIETFLAQ